MNTTARYIASGRSLSSINEYPRQKAPS